MSCERDNSTLSQICVTFIGGACHLYGVAPVVLAGRFSPKAACHPVPRREQQHRAALPRALAARLGPEIRLVEARAARACRQVVSVETLRARPRAEQFRQRAERSALEVQRRAAGVPRPEAHRQRVAPLRSEALHRKVARRRRVAQLCSEALHRGAAPLQRVVSRLLEAHRQRAAHRRRVEPRRLEARLQGVARRQRVEPRRRLATRHRGVARRQRVEPRRLAARPRRVERPAPPRRSITTCALQGRLH
jgi:hypothetical protein